MQLNIYSSENYVIISDGTNTFEYAKGYTTYTLKNNIFYIKETVGGEYQVTVADINAGNIKTEANVAYTVSTFTSFLRKNTGFKTAAGGSAAAPIGALLQKSGQTTSYRTGDDGDLEAGRLTSFTSLSANNPFSNTNRFTDELGGQTYTNNIVIDWSTYDGTNVLGASRLSITTGNTWNQAIDNSISYSVGTFTSGWRLPNIKEIVNFLNFGNNENNLLNYSPLNLSSLGRVYWSSTTVLGQTSLVYGLSNVGSIGQLTKTSSAALTYFRVRTFTVTGTTLS